MAHLTILFALLPVLISGLSVQSDVITLFEYSFDDGIAQFRREIRSFSLSLLSAIDSIKCKTGVELTDVTSIGKIKFYEMKIIRINK